MGVLVTQYSPPSILTFTNLIADFLHVGRVYQIIQLIRATWIVWPTKELINYPRVISHMFTPHKHSTTWGAFRYVRKELANHSHRSRFGVFVKEFPSLTLDNSLKVLNPGVLHIYIKSSLFYPRTPDHWVVKPRLSVCRDKLRFGIIISKAQKNSLLPQNWHFTKQIPSKAPKHPLILKKFSKNIKKMVIETLPNTMAWPHCENAQILCLMKIWCLDRVFGGFRG